MQVGRLVPALDAHLLELPVRSELGHELRRRHDLAVRRPFGGAGDAHAKQEVRDDVLGRADSQRERGRQQKLATCLVAVRGGPLEHLRRDHPLGEVVDLLQPAALRDGQATGLGEPVEGTFAG